MCMFIQKQITIPAIMNPYNRRDKRSSLRTQAVIPRCALLKAYRHFTTLHERNDIYILVAWQSPRTMFSAHSGDI